MSYGCIHCERCAYHESVQSPPTSVSKDARSDGRYRCLKGFPAEEWNRCSVYKKSTKENENVETGSESQVD